MPVSVGGTAANLLLPLYAVIGAGILAYAWNWLRSDEDTTDAECEPLLRWLQIAFAAVLGLYTLQALYSIDREQALKNFCLFYVPFALLFVLLLDANWSPRLLRLSFIVTVVLALAFAVIGCIEFATGHLLITNEKVVTANDLLPYFRGQLAVLRPEHLRPLPRADHDPARRRAAVDAPPPRGCADRRRARAAVGRARVLALAVELRRVAARPRGAGRAALEAVAGARADRRRGRRRDRRRRDGPGALNIETGKQNVWNRATSGRADLVEGGLRMVRDRPLYGFGSGSYSDEYRRREHVSSEKIVAASHTIPLTVTAEQGIVGLLAYVALIGVSLALLFSGLRARLKATEWPGTSAVAQAGIAAAYAALLLHTIVYAAYLEDPLTWALLAIAAGLRRENGISATARVERPEAVGVGGG